MMLPLIAAGIMGAAAPAPVTTDQLANLFISACFDGSAQLSAKDAEAVPFDRLPGSLRSKLIAPDKAQVWRLRSGGESYLYILDYKGPGQNPQICGLASDTLAVSPAVDTVAQRVGATVDEHSRGQAVEWWLPEQGYMALASRLRGYTVLQVNQLSDEQRREASRAR
ncbi:MAG TPA: hypothetical protein VGE68_00890 [Sphingomicrobium sp.]